MSDSDTLETLIDQRGFWEVMEEIESICYAKAEHLRTNWQDDEAAKTWERRAKSLGKFTLGHYL